MLVHDKCVEDHVVLPCSDLEVLGKGKIREVFEKGEETHLVMHIALPTCRTNLAGLRKTMT